jgi:hypothetical protein
MQEHLAHRSYLGYVVVFIIGSTNQHDDYNDKAVFSVLYVLSISLF